ncbi:helix-turn-helix domain-containing protein [Salinicola peritrichatus]|uniref:helix-turn-helix domain-containing protein n=1 Tax=Salinicola peritrichatus TaxID=1267424 RepID=UPI000DA11B0B|nr:helix-turn-helix domain-containing protein [Salinicola peritrichatus]
MRVETKKPGLSPGRAHSNTVAELDPTTQTGRVLEALRRHPMSAAELQWDLRIAHAPAAIRDLRNRGFTIVTEWHPQPAKPKAKIKRYRLVETE